MLPRSIRSALPLWVLATIVGPELTAQAVPVLRYRGSSRIEQRSGEATLADETYVTRLLVVPESRAPDTPADGPRLFVRGLTSGDETSATIQRLLPARPGGRDVLLDVPQALDTVHRPIAVYAPLRWLPLEADDPAEVLGSVPVPGEYAATRSTTDGVTTYRHTLRDEARPRFTFGNDPARLDGWEEEHVLRDGLLDRYTNRSRVTLRPDDAASIIVTITSRLELESAEAPTGVDAYVLDASLAALRELETKARARAPSSELAELAARIATLADGGSFDLLARAAATYVSSHAATFESSDAGRLLAQQLDRPPFDFTLEDLDGKKVTLSEAIRGKVAYLNFWGVG